MHLSNGVQSQIKEILYAFETLFVYVTPIDIHIHTLKIKLTRNLLKEITRPPLWKVIYTM